MGNARFDVAQVKAAANLSRIVGGYITLRKVGSQRYGGGCPFHEEKTDSFQVRDDWQRFHCFGCDLQGDVFDFVGRIEGLSRFPERLRRVAELAGVQPLDEAPMSPLERDRMRVNRHQARALSIDIADWAHGLNLWAERRKAALLNTRAFAWRSGADVLAEYAEQQLAAIPRAALSPTTTDPGIIARAFMAARSNNPQATARIRDLGKDDREHAAAITREIVGLLVAKTAMDGRVAA